jgi:hypothetical protein
MLDINEIRSMFQETVREACEKGLIDPDFAEIATSGVESEDVGVDYGSFADKSFKNEYDVFERFPQGMDAKAIYDPGTKTVILNSDELDGSIIYAYKMAMIHEMTHYCQDMTHFEGRLVDAEVDATIAEHVYVMAEFEFQHDEGYLYEQYVAGEMEKDVLVAEIDLYLTKRLNVDPSPEFLYWLSSKCYLSSYEAEIFAWYQMNGDAGLSSRKMEFEETYVNSRISGELFGDLRLAAKTEPYKLLQLLEDRPKELEEINWDDPEDVKLALTSMQFYSVYLANFGTRAEFEDYFRYELWPAYYMAFETLPFETTDI